MSLKPSTPTPANPEAPAAMDQVRDLLFGAQIKEMDTRLQRQEERFARALDDAKGAMKNRIESLENFMKSEVASILARIKEEQTERNQAFKDEVRERNENIAHLTKELGTLAETLERKSAKLSSTLDTMDRELRQLLLRETGSLAEKIEEKYQDGQAVLQRTATQIRADMVHRASLASMFTELAVKLNGQWAESLDQEGRDAGTLPAEGNE